MIQFWVKNYLEDKKVGNKFVYVLAGFFLLFTFMALIIIPSSKHSKKNGIEGEATTTEELIGGEKDEHGCLVAAGYSWCEEKQTCLRVWEEGCDDITTLLAELDKATSETFSGLSEELLNWIGESGEVELVGYSKTVYGTVADLDYEISQFMKDEGFLEDGRNFLDNMEPAIGYRKEGTVCLVSSTKSDGSTPLSSQSEDARDFIVKCGKLE